MIHLFYSDGKIFHLKEGSDELKLSFYEYDYKFSSKKIDDLVKGGHFAFVTFQKGKPLSIQMSPQYNSVINKKNISYVEVNEILIGDREFEYLKTTVKISDHVPEFGQTEINKYLEKCYKFINERK